jgi:hypothetical protein
VRRKVEFAEPETTVAPLRGRDGWLFLTGDSNDVIAQHTGAFVPDRRWERRWSRQLRGRARLMRRLGATYVQLVVPDKEAVYADLLPAEIVPAPRRPVHRLVELAAGAEVELVYPLAQLRAGRRSAPVFHPTDTHWTGRGAYIGYRAACDALGGRSAGLRVVGEDEIEWVDDTRAGDLGSKLDPPLRGTGARARLDSRARTVDDNLIYVTGRRLVTERPGEHGPSCVIFGTSYAVFTLLFFAETFRRLVFVHSTSVDRETVRAERPDVVMAITAERGLRRPPDDRAAHDLLAEVVERKRRDGQLIDPRKVELHGQVRLLPPPLAAP